MSEHFLPGGQYNEEGKLLYHEPICTKSQLVMADLICFNYAVYGKDYFYSWAWFPITYIYDNEYQSVLREIAGKMISKEHVQDILPLFGYNNIEEFVDTFSNVNKEARSAYKDYHHNGTFERTHLLGDFIQEEQIASLR